MIELLIGFFFVYEGLDFDKIDGPFYVDFNQRPLFISRRELFQKVDQGLNEETRTTWEKIYLYAQYTK